MESLYLLVPLVLIIIGIAIKVLFWAINSGQYDNLDSEGHRILFDDPAKKDATKNQKNNSNDSEQKDSTSSS